MNYSFVTKSSIPFIGCILICSCSNNYEFNDSDLSIDSQIPITRSSSEGGGVEDAETKNKEIPHNSNECPLFSLTELWIEKRLKDDSDYFKHPFQTAKDYYNGLKSTIENNPSKYDWIPGSNEGMKTSEFEKLGKEKGLLGDFKQFATADEMKQWLSNDKNRKNVAVVFSFTDDEDGNQVGHYARVKGISSHSVSFSGYNGHNNFGSRWDGGTIYFQTEYDKEGNPKPGRDSNNQDFQIKGVYLKP